MTKFLLLAGVVFLSACSPQQEVKQQELLQSASGIYVNSVSPVSTPEGSFGTISTATTLTKIINLRSQTAITSNHSITGADA